ncbi:hypothetical protein BV22DRAFT_1130117 [Leucogyrophana mollusca]|uniref:Uncharacterized protein n=1 Tax=Leucogyrophana mollusca TaxID=85980 RepID=A0ACB8BFV9_9AGAM|nr:hypothetical protein BV22DRAFT_1130117 [Leucogyrophana mollusca]
MPRLDFDVLLLIFNSLLRDVHGASLLPAQSQTYLKDFAALARTCRAFCNPALDILWSTQVSLVPFMSTFPRDLWEFLTRNITSNEWERPLIYARRIKRLALGRHEVPLASLPTEAHHTTLCSLLSAFPSELLFPNLSELKIGSASWKFGAHFQRFEFCLLRLINPKFRLLDFASDPVLNPNLSSIVDSIFKTCCELETLKIHVDHWRRSETLHMTQLDQLRRLRSLRISGEWASVSPDALLRIGSLENLEDLNIHLLDNAYADISLWQGFPGDLFKSLRKLTLNTFALEYGDALIYSISSTRLEEISLNTYRKQHHTSLHNTFKSLARQSLHFPNLRSLIVSLPTLYRAEELISPANAPSIICPLLSGSFRALRTLEIKLTEKFPVPVPLDISEIPDALPFLEVLKLPYLVAEGMTLHSVLQTARRCKFLRVLGVDFNGTVINEPSEGEEPATTLRVLKVGRSPIDEPNDVATFLQRWFPNLTRVKPSSLSEWEEEWEEVNDLVTSARRGDTDRG